MALAIGVTGGIGSGKSTVCRMFEILGAPVFEADKVAKQLLDSHEGIKSGLIRLFGKNIYSAEGTVNREKLAGIIFNDDLYLQNMNNLVHPVVREEFASWLKKKKTLPYVVLEAAILFEGGFYEMMDFTLLVTAPEAQRIARVMKRDEVTENLVRERMDKQWPDEEKEKRANMVLKNDNNRLLIPEIIKIDKNLKEYGKIW